MKPRNQIPLTATFRLLSFVALLFPPLFARAQTVVATVPVGMPRTLAVNPATNKIYTAGCRSEGFAHIGGIAVIDGESNTATQVASGCIAAVGAAVNSATNKIYVVDAGRNVTVIDGVSNSITTVNIHSTSNIPNTSPLAMAVNPITNKIYVGNGDGTVTVIDGATNSITTITDPNASGFSATAVAINPVTNKIYVTNNNENNLNFGSGPGNITVIDGATNNTTTLTDPNALSPDGVAVNPVTNKIYVANSGNVTVLDGATNSITTVTGPNAPAVGSLGFAVAVNFVTNKIYVANRANNNVMVIDGATNSATTVADPNAVSPVSVAVNSTTNKIYVANQGCGNGCNPGSVTVIDGATNSVTTVIDPAAEISPVALALNPNTDKIYVANVSVLRGNVTVIDGNAAATTHTLSAVLVAAPLLPGRGTGVVTSNPAGINCTASCTASFAVGTTVQLTASPTSGSQFSGWSTNCTGAGPCSIAMTSDQFVTATFIPPPDFSLQLATEFLTAQRGAQESDVLTIAPQNGSFTNVIQLSCSVIGSIPGATCALSPTSVTPGANSVTSTLTVTVPAQAAELIPSLESRPSGPFYAVFLPVPLALIGFGWASGKLKQRKYQLWLLYSLFLAFIALQAGCGGGSNNQTTPPLNYTVTVTATSGTLQHTTQVRVTVP